MYSTFQRANHYASVSTTFVMVLLGLISLASFFGLPAVDQGRITVHDLVVQKGRLQRFNAPMEEIANMRFDIKTDLTPLLNSYNTKQLYVYLTAAFEDDVTHDAHEVVLWDRILVRSDSKDFRTVGAAAAKKNRSFRPRLRVEDAKPRYPWRNPSRSFKNIHHANLTLSYHLMPYVGLLTSGVAATADGPIEIPPLAIKGTAKAAKADKPGK